MTNLEELKEEVKSRAPIDAEVVSATDADTEESSGYIYDDDDFALAMDLLAGSMRTLGFFGDKKVSGIITRMDRERMLKQAEEIKQFIDLVNSYELVD